MILDKQQSIIIVLFLILLFGIFLLSSFRDFDSYKNLQTSKFSPNNKDPHAFSNMKIYIQNNMDYHLNLKSEFSLISDDNNYNFTFPQGKIYLGNKKSFLFSGEKGEIYASNDKDIEVIITKAGISDNKSSLNADIIFYSKKNSEIQGNGNVIGNIENKRGDLINIRSNKMRVDVDEGSLYYSGKVKGYIKKKRIYEKGNIEFSAGRGEVDKNRLKVSLYDDISIKKQRVKVSGYRGEIFFENPNKKLRYFVVYDDVRLVQLVKPANSIAFERKAFAEKLEGLSTEDKIILTGYPQVYQRNDVIKGSRIILRKDKEELEIDDVNSRFKIK